MKHNSGNRRSRNRNSGGKRQGGGGRNNYESNGPEVKVRGTAQQVLEKYLALARDAASAGDRIKSESYFQFAEHYYRIVNADGNANANNNQNRRDNQQDSQQDDDSDDTAQQADGSGPQPDVAVVENTNAASSADGTSASEDETPSEDGKIDESVLPAAAPTQPRRRRSRAKAETSGESEPEAAQA